MAADFLNGLPVRPHLSPTTSARTPAANPQAKTSFADALTQVQHKAGTLNFSAHARQRIEQRGMSLKATDVQQLAQAVDMLAQKGAKDGYVVYGNQGFVVNIPNRTVVTTMGHDAPTVITKIDGVAVVPRLDH